MVRGCTARRRRPAGRADRPRVYQLRREYAGLERHDLGQLSWRRGPSSPAHGRGWLDRLLLQRWLAPVPHHAALAATAPCPSAACVLKFICARAGRPAVDRNEAGGRARSAGSVLQPADRRRPGSASVELDRVRAFHRTRRAAARAAASRMHAAAQDQGVGRVQRLSCRTRRRPPSARAGVRAPGTALGQLAPSTGANSGSAARRVAVNARAHVAQARDSSRSTADGRWRKSDHSRCRASWKNGMRGSLVRPRRAERSPLAPSRVPARPPTPGDTGPECRPTVDLRWQRRTQQASHSPTRSRRVCWVPAYPAHPAAEFGGGACWGFGSGLVGMKVLADASSMTNPLNANKIVNIVATAQRPSQLITSNAPSGADQGRTSFI